ncbi:hypothetical protein BV898_07899 [Hypsibius exemplaris]|uniref:Cadherin domain-containing protein n=1 Tax=Hypsibius exemplaris TaxID=2072580 RepID=A0A1W0WRY7_HYPEX|nr:hypothetical protein BV898_07899 [Hypsibius exemplaris]
MFLFTLGILAVGVASVQSQSCLVSNTQNLRPLEEPRLTDEDVIGSLRRWGYVCCRADASSLKAILEPNKKFTFDSCNGPKSEGILLQVNPTQSNVNCSTPQGYVRCEISIQGDLSDYLDRRVSCMYNPVITLTCNVSTSAATISTDGLGFLDGSVDPAWSTTDGDFILTPVSEFTAVGTAVLESHLGMLFVSDTHDIWGSDQWKIDLSITDEANAVLRIDQDLTVFPNSTIPVGSNQDGRTTPTLRLNRLLPFELCTLNTAGKCIYDTQLVASNPSGSSKAITIRLEVLDENDHPPAFIDFPTDTFFIDEDDVNQSINLPTIKAADGDKGLNCRIAFTLDNGGDEFRINSDSGVIVVKSPLAWSPSQSNRYVVTVRAAEVPESVEGKCRAEMFAVATLTVEVTSVRSNPITITTNPSVLTVFNYQTEEVQIGTVEVRRSGAILPSSNFTLTVPAASSFTVDAAGNLRKKAGLTVPVTTTVRLTVTDAKDRALGATDLTVVAQEAIPPRFTSVPADAVGCATPGVILPVDVGSDLSSPVTVTVADSVAKCVVITRATTAEGMLQSVTVAAATDGPCGPEFSVDVVLRSRRGNDVAQLRFTGCPDIPDPSFAHPLYELNAYGTPDGLSDVTPSRETAAVRNCGRDGAPCHCETVASLPGENLLTLNNVTGSVTVVAFPDGRLTENLYTSKVFITCRDGDPEKAHASTTILINWRPRPEFDNLTVTVPENTPIGQRLTTVHPLHQFPYTLRYRVGDGNTIIAIDPATGDVTLNRKLSFAEVPVHSLVLLAFDETRPTDDPVEVMLRVTVLEEFHQAKFIDLPTAPVACGSGGVVLAIDLGTEEADGLDFEVFGQSPSCVVMVSRPGATPGQLSLNVTESTGGLCGTNYTVTVIMKSARANDYAALNFTGCSAVPVPTFGLTLLEVNVHSDASVPFPLELLPPVADCLACQCELATANPFVSISNPSLGTLNVVSFPPDAFFDSQSSSAVQVVCTSATTHGVAQTSVIVHWHLVPRFTASQPMTAYVNGPSEQYLTTLHPENPNFPYALVYRPADSNVLDISVSDNGVVTLTNPAKLGTALTHTVVIQVFEELRPSIQVANVTLIINAATILVPAKFVTVPVDPVSCKGSGAIVTVDLGTESGATVSVMGDQAKCVLISPSSLAPGSLSVVVTQNASGFCGTNFNVGLVLESATSNDVASLQFIGCDATPVPSFNSTFYEIDLYPPTNASDAIPLSVPSPVLDCLDCSCALERPSTVFSVDPTTGVLTVRQFPLHGEIDAYTTSVGVICTSGATNATVQTAVLVRWHIPPRFVQPSPVTVLDTSSTGQYLTTLHTETLYPYDLTYTPHSGNLVPTTVSVNGVVTLADPVDLSTAPSYNLVYTVAEAERPTVEVGQILLVVNVAKSFRPARFADAPEGSVACSADGLTVTVELGTEEQVEVKAVGTQAKCVKVTPALITETSGKSVTITENLAGFCGAEFTVALVLEGVGPSRDTISLDFVGCTPLSAPRFPAFPLMDIYPASAPLPITVSPDVLACRACNCTFEGTPPAHSIFTLNNTNGQVTVTGFPVLAEFTPDSYTSQGVVLCRNADTGLEARRQIQVRWHPTPEFSQPSVLTVSDHTVEGTPLLVLRPDKNYPYTLQYAVDENPAVNVNINTGIVTLKSALTAGTEHPVMFRVTQPTSPVGTPATNVSMLIQIRAGFLPAKFGTSTATGECDGTDVTVSVNLGNENADDLAFAIVGDERGCVTTLTVTRNPTGGLTVAIAANQTDQCGVKFAAALVLTGGQSRDVFTVTFTGCPEPTVVLPPQFALDSYETAIYPAQSEPFPLAINSAVERCDNCFCSFEHPIPPFIHSANIQKPAPPSSSTGVLCRNSLNPRKLPSPITLPKTRCSWSFVRTYELQYTVDPNSVVKVDPDTGTVTLEKAFNASTEHNVTFRVTQRNSPVGTTVAEVPLRIRFTASFIPATFSQSEMTVACGDPDVTALVNLGSEVVLSYRIIGDEEDCVEPPTVATSPEGTQRVRLTAIQPTQCGENFTAALVLTGSQSRDVFAVTFTGCSGPTVYPVRVSTPPSTNRPLPPTNDPTQFLFRASPVLRLSRLQLRLERPSTVFSVDPTPGPPERPTRPSKPPFSCGGHSPPFVQPSPVTVLDTPHRTVPSPRFIQKPSIRMIDLPHRIPGNRCPNYGSVNGVVTLADPVDLSTASRTISFTPCPKQRNRPWKLARSCWWLTLRSRSGRQGSRRPGGSVLAVPTVLRHGRLGTEEQVESEGRGTQAKCVNASAPSFPSLPSHDIYRRPHPLPSPCHPTCACSACTAPCEAPLPPLIFTLNTRTGQVTSPGSRLADSPRFLHLPGGRSAGMPTPAWKTRRQSSPVASDPGVPNHRPHVSDTPSRVTPLFWSPSGTNYPYTLQYAVDRTPR